VFFSGFRYLVTWLHPLPDDIWSDAIRIIAHDSKDASYCQPKAQDRFS